ncbi:general secretion pathway protein GspB [Marinibactrum halimedae]|uniref:general secretion pathway protein GspB n=1 Tax=Marinibactrum halimedae TaxID=1444977 RepID=UPI001E587125|nr:general secretion pathway protein GspB [Marinibactrum halimedae]MCD9460825.1 general secretion pathway protein GspB [Marinibactrum halimedae]
MPLLLCYCLSLFVAGGVQAQAQIERESQSFQKSPDRPLVDLNTLSDPTRPIYFRPSVSSISQSLRLSSVVFRDNKRTAIINGKRVKEGDSIVGGGVVSRIRERSVLIRKNGKTHTLYLNNHKVKVVR